MHTRKLVWTATFCLTCLAAATSAQDAQKIIDQYIKTEGGAKALSKVRTYVIEGSFQTKDGKAGTYTLTTRLPNRYYLEIVAGDASQIEAYNGKSAWRRA